MFPECDPTQHEYNVNKCEQRNMQSFSRLANKSCRDGILARQCACSQTSLAGMVFSQDSVMFMLETVDHLSKGIALLYFGTASLDCLHHDCKRDRFQKPIAPDPSSKILLTILPSMNHSITFVQVIQPTLNPLST